MYKFSYYTSEQRRENKIHNREEKNTTTVQEVAAEAAKRT